MLLRNRYFYARSTYRRCQKHFLNQHIGIPRVNRSNATYLLSCIIMLISLILKEILLLKLQSKSCILIFVFLSVHCQSLKYSHRELDLHPPVANQFWSLLRVN